MGQLWVLGSVPALISQFSSVDPEGYETCCTCQSYDPFKYLFGGGGVLAVGSIFPIVPGELKTYALKPF